MNAPEEPTDTALEIAKQSRDYAWDWFAFHAAQRMQTFNFFLIATAFIIAAYGAPIGKYPEAATIVAMLGAWFAYWFVRLDRRNKQLVKTGEAALKVCEARLSELASIPELKIVASVEKTNENASSYGRVISMIQWMIFGVSVIAAIYALASAI